MSPGFLAPFALLLAVKKSPNSYENFRTAERSGKTGN
jgi:hypothetical protein